MCDNYYNDLPEELLKQKTNPEANVLVDRKKPVASLFLNGHCAINLLESRWKIRTRKPKVNWIGIYVFNTVLLFKYFRISLPTYK